MSDIGKLLNCDDSKSFNSMAYGKLVHLVLDGLDKNRKGKQLRINLLSALWGENPNYDLEIDTSVEVRDGVKHVFINLQSITKNMEKVFERILSDGMVIVHALKNTISEASAVRKTRTQGTVASVVSTSVVTFGDSAGGNVIPHQLWMKLWDVKQVQFDDFELVVRAKAAECPDFSLGTALKLLDRSVDLKSVQPFGSEEGIIDWSYVTYKSPSKAAKTRSETSSQWRTKTTVPRGRYVNDQLCTDELMRGVPGENITFAE